jgi:oxygen-dependent protoporphyrinogen oxidase
MNAAATPSESGHVWDVLVVGAGMTGLVAAYRLHQAGLKVRVMDAGTQPGGVIASVHRDGCMFERGPNSAMDTTPLIGELVEELGLKPQLRWASAASEKRYVVRGGKLIPLPMSPGAFFSTPLFSIAAKAGLMLEPFKAPSDPAVEESIAAFVRRRLGQEFLDYAIDPFVSGIYAGNPDQISVKAAFPKLHALEQRWGSLIKGQFLGAAERKRAKETAKNTAKSFSFEQGMQTLPLALASALGGVAYQTRATALQRDAQGVFTVQADQQGQAVAWQARSVILAVAADAAAALVRPHAPDAAAAMDAIEYAPVATVASAYNTADIAHPLDGFGCLLPGKEKRRVLGVLFSSSMFDSRAPQGVSLLTTFMGGRRSPDLPAMPPDEIAALAHAEHGILLGATAAPRWQVVTRWPRAIPQYVIGHLGRVARADAAEQALPGLRLCGSWKGGVSVGDCLRNGHDMGVATAAWLKARAA